MKRIRSLAAALVLCALPAQAGVLPHAAPAEDDSTSVTAVRALLTRCMPPVMSDKPLVTHGLVRADQAATEQLLGGRPGQVWTDRDVRIVLIDFHDLPVCRVIGLQIDPKVLSDLVLRLFDDAKTPFRQQRFRLDRDGGFAAVYAAGSETGTMIVTISTAISVEGARFATLTLERTGAVAE